MKPFHSLLEDDPNGTFALIDEALRVRRHVDLLLWLQGGVQRVLPHEIMLAAWGDFRLGLMAHDIVSTLPGIRTERAGIDSVSPLLSALYRRWIAQGRRPFIMRTEDDGFVTGGEDGVLATALSGMRSALVHGICDQRGRHDVLYVLFDSRAVHTEPMITAMHYLLPYLDTALRQVPQLRADADAACDVAPESPEHGLSEREREIMTWLKAGKTNQEIGMILDISAFTVKNHLKRIYRKLGVFNRMQAVTRYDNLLQTNGAN